MPNLDNLDAAIYKLYSALNYRNNEQDIRNRVKDALKLLRDFKEDLAKEKIPITVSNEKRDLPI